MGKADLFWWEMRGFEGVGPSQDPPNSQLDSPEPSWLYTRQVMLALDSLFTWKNWKKSQIQLLFLGILSVKLPDKDLKRQKRGVEEKK